MKVRLNNGQTLQAKPTTAAAVAVLAPSLHRAEGERALLYVAPVWQRMREGWGQAAGRLAAAEGQGRRAAKCPYPSGRGTDGGTDADGVSREQMKEGTTVRASCTAIECLKKQLPRQTDGWRRQKGLNV